MLFFNSTKDWLTASRASARLTALPNNAVSPAFFRAEGLGFCQRFARALTRKIRVTASSIRAIGIMPLFTCAITLR